MGRFLSGWTGLGAGSRVVLRVESDGAQPSVWVRQRLGFEVDEVQARVLDCRAEQVLLCCSRQWGKTTLTAAEAIRTAMCEPGSVIVIASRSLRQSLLLLEKVRRFARRLLQRTRPDLREPHSLRFRNGSVVFALPCTEATTRGFDGVTLLIIDEASRVPETVYAALRPMRATTQGRLWLMSTPRGEGGFFAEAWRDETQEWARFRVPVTECPRIRAEFLAMERKALGSHRYAEEYLCEFLPAPTQLIPAYVLEGALSGEEEAFEWLG